MTETVPHGQAVLIFVMVCRQAQIIWLAEYSLISHTTVTNERSIRGAMILFFLELPVHADFQKGSRGK